MSATVESDLVALLRSVLADLSLYGVLADYLQERGDGRGVLLRRRGKRWQDNREVARRDVAFCILRGYTVFYKDRPAYADDTFRKYIRRWFRASIL